MPSRARRAIRFVLAVAAVVVPSRLPATTGHFGDGVALVLGVLGGVAFLLVLASRVR